jgi:hypothetical protein
MSTTIYNANHMFVFSWIIERKSSSYCIYYIRTSSKYLFPLLSYGSYILTFSLPYPFPLRSIKRRQQLTSSILWQNVENFHIYLSWKITKRIHHKIDWHLVVFVFFFSLISFIFLLLPRDWFNYYHPSTNGKK